jgi:DNA-binding XRE family transcriptional regulator
MIIFNSYSDRVRYAHTFTSLWLTTVTPDEQEFYKALGARIADFRRDRELTQQEMADALGVSQQVYAHYEVGRVRIQISLLPALVGMLGTTVPTLLGPLGKPIPPRKAAR